jgi:hypothetical protein
MSVRQVTPWKQWPSGDSRPIVVLPYSLTELTERYGLRYEEGIDDLDRYQLAAIDLAEYGQAWIYKHDSDPNPGTVVYVDAATEIGEAESMIMGILGLRPEQLLWLAPVPLSI